MAQFLSDCVNDRLNEVPYDSKFITPDNILCLIMVEKKAQAEDMDNELNAWLGKFVSDYTTDCIYANIKEGQVSYIMGRFSYLWGSLEKYIIQINESEVA